MIMEFGSIYYYLSLALLIICPTVLYLFLRNKNDDVIKFVEREIRRGNKYDAIIMDPPSFGRGANKEVWRFEDNLYDLVKLCTEVLSDDPLFFLINSYTTGISSEVLRNILLLNFGDKGIIQHGELGLSMQNSRMNLPCGIYGRWEKENE